jgi:hypothetical protein
MGVAAGGLIKQAIVRDPGTHKWDASQTKIFNVQILNTLHFEHVTGFRAPDPPIDSSTYAEYGYPFFSMYEEPTQVSGDFARVRSIGQIDGVQEPSISPRIIDITNNVSPATDWVCGACTLINQGTHRFCEACYTAKQASNVTSHGQSALEEWACDVCTLINYASHQRCEACGIVRQDSDHSLPPPTEPPTAAPDEPSIPLVIAFWNPRPPMTEFRSLQDLEIEVRQRGSSIF